MCEPQSLAGLVRLRLVEIREQQQAVGPVADIRYVDQRVPGDLALNGEEPAPDVGVLRVARQVGDVCCERIEVGRVGQTRRITLLRREKPWLAGGLVDHGIHHLRAVDGQQIRRAAAMEVDVADPESAANHSLRHHLIGDSHSRRPVAQIRMHQATIVAAAFLRLEDRGSRGIEVAEVIVRLELRRTILVKDSQVERELIAELEIVLNIGEMHVLLKVSDK